ncbi:hypothetical protein ES332_D12G120700v1, partial [Gossypium tomentosum]
ILFFSHASSAILSFSSIAWDLYQIWRINLCHGPNPGSLCEWWKRSYRYRYVNGRKEVTNIGDYTVAANVYQKILEIWHAYGCYQKLQ